MSRTMIEVSDVTMRFRLNNDKILSLAVMSSESNGPFVSVLMGIYYQREDLRLLERSINSILSQNYSNFELLICDDGSSPRARKAIDSIAERDGRIHLVRTGALFSLPQKLNACLRSSQGTLIARMDDDDFSHPNRFEAQIAYLAMHPEIDFVGCSVRLWRNGGVAGTRHLPALPGTQDFLFVQPFIHPTIMCDIVLTDYEIVNMETGNTCLVRAGDLGAGYGVEYQDFSAPRKTLPSIHGTTYRTQFLRSAGFQMQDDIFLRTRNM